MKKINRLLVLVTMMLTISLLSLSGNKIEAAKSSVKVSVKSNTKSMGPVKNTNSAETFSTMTGPSGISKVTHVSRNQFYVYIKMTNPIFSFYTLNLKLRVHYYNGKIRNVKVAHGDNGVIGKAWTKNVYIPKVGNHGYVELVGNAISDGTLVVSKCMKPRAAF
ncbi:hypothetical protein F5ESL0233_05160 [Lactobacillus sp. ESL0233]|uniref:hypothetical protein n=1 Tax=Lactobacillus sp. ESL0233 TaxID=2069354 RepID=UPI000EFAA77B|nr:hypothetical protein [Lactobacillus sp. ESL0233]RMC41707.1 hypothetical protein F5ESL0233_05160 [Lactobacillus sp. ESL0233]